jgi:hypothetical protein
LGNAGSAGDNGGAIIEAGATVASTGGVGGDLRINVIDAGPKPGDCIPMPEICDGIDNDCDGIIDNVDVNHDGICDCLNVATIGHVGTWGTGNVFTGWLKARTSNPPADLGDEVLTEDLLRPFEVVVFLSTTTVDIYGTNGLIPKHHAFSDAEAQAFKKWIQGGGGAMATTGYNYGGNHEEENINKLFSTIGLTYKSNGYISGYIKNWMPHPVSMGIMNIYIENGVECSGDGAVVATDNSTKVALQVAESAMGRAVMWGDEWITYDELWEGDAAVDQQVPRLWANILKWLTPPKKCQVPIPDIVK